MKITQEIRNTNKDVKTLEQEIETLKKQTENLNMAMRINQAMLKQLMDNLVNLGGESKNLTGMFNDFQYRFLATQKLLNVNTEDVAKISDSMKLEDWTKASEKDDVDNGFQEANTVTSASDVVIITSKTPDEAEDKGIFRSKVLLSETGSKELIDGLMNKTVGDVVEVQLNGIKHVITLLGVRVKPAE
jgi:predicted nuclease with TOPRIM domain